MSICSISLTRAVFGFFKRSIHRRTAWRHVSPHSSSHLERWRRVGVLERDALDGDAPAAGARARLLDTDGVQPLPGQGIQKLQYHHKRTGKEIQTITFDRGNKRATHTRAQHEHAANAYYAWRHRASHVCVFWLVGKWKCVVLRFGVVVVVVVVVVVGGLCSSANKLPIIT